MNYQNHPLNVFQYVTFSQLYLLINLRFLRLKMGRRVLEDGKSEMYLEKVHFIKINGNGGGTNYETQDEYEVRCTESIKSAIYPYIISAKIWQRRYYGELPEDAFERKLGGSAEYRYFDLPDFWDLFSKAFLCGYMHTEVGSSILAFFFKEDMVECEKSGRKYHVISIPMSEEELEQQQMDEDPAAGIDFEPTDYKDDGEIYDDDKDSWMDNKDDHWNVD